MQPQHNVLASEEKKPAKGNKNIFLKKLFPLNFFPPFVSYKMSKFYDFLMQKEKGNYLLFCREIL